jgi:hypothetical protein
MYDKVTILKKATATVSVNEDNLSSKMIDCLLFNVHRLIFHSYSWRAKGRVLIVVTTVDIVPSISYPYFSVKGRCPVVFPSPTPPSFLLNMYTLLNELDLLLAKNMRNRKTDVTYVNQ